MEQHMYEDDDGEVETTKLESHLNDEELKQDEFTSKEFSQRSVLPTPANIDLSNHFETNRIFDNKDALVNWCQSEGKKLKMVIVIQKSEIASCRRLGRLLLGCERGGTYRRQKSRDSDEHRSSSTKKCGCPFKLKGLPQLDGKWKLSVECGLHNHDLHPILTGHSYAGRLTSEEKKCLVQMSKSGSTPKMILHTLKKQDGNNQSTRKTIYNVRTRQRLIEQQGLTCVQYTMRLLEENKYIHFVKEDTTRNVVTQIFWAHPSSLDLIKCFPRVLIVDCTYKTNRYKMPLFEIVGVASTGQSFNVAFVFMDKETVESYVWALEHLKAIIDPEWLPELFVTDKEQALIKAIEIVFPKARRLLCKWHINKNITAHCKKEFETNEESEEFLQDWDDIVKAITEEQFNTKWATFEEKWRTHPKCVSYVRSSWLPLKEYFATAWTKYALHFGCTTTQRAESAHSNLKSQLKTSTGNFPLVLKAMDAMVNLQKWELEGSFQQSIFRVKNKHNLHPLFNFIKGQISSFAMDIIWREMKRGMIIGTDKDLCGCLKRRTYGLPCAHELVELSLQSRSIPLESIHPHWKQLSTTKLENIDAVVTYEDDYKLFQSLWKKSSDVEKRALKRKIQDIVCPSSTLLGEPIVKEKNKGRPTLRKSKAPKGKTSVNSTKRDPSGFEYAKTQEDEQLSQASVSSKKRKLQIKRGKGALGSGEKYLKYISSWIQPILNSLQDVPLDGHCGFHVCAFGLGLPEIDGWSTVRKDLIRELELHKELYERMWGEKEVHTQRTILDCFDNNAPRTNWMDLPSHDILAANWYNRPFFLIGPRESWTILPFFNEPVGDIEKQLFGWAKIDEYNHFVYVTLKSDSPLPPLWLQWPYYRQPQSEAWRTKLNGRMEMWRLIKPVVQNPSASVIEL